MRNPFTAALLILFAAAFLFGAEAGKKDSPPPADGRKIFRPSSSLPPSIIGIVRTIENRMAPWSVEKVAPLTETVRYRFAINGWRITLNRPLTQEAAAKGVVSPEKIRSNTAEIIFVPLRKGADPARVRTLLLWTKGEQEMYNTVCYLGRTGASWQLFARADVVTLDTLLQLFNCQDGDPMEKILAEALLAEDLENLTRRNVPIRIRRFGDKALPPLRIALGKALALRQDPQFVLHAVKAIDTPAAAAELMRALRSGEPSVEKAAVAVMSCPPYMKNGTEIYRELLKEHKNTEFCIFALEAAGDKAFLLQQLSRMKQEPQSYLELVAVNFSLVRLRTGKQTIPENDIAEQICLLFARNGDLPGSPKMVSMKSADASYAGKISQEEMARIQPLIDRMLASKDTDTAILCTLFLVLFSPEGDGFSKEYISKINRCGLSILSRLPRTRVLQILNTLKENVIHQKESETFARIAARFR